MYSPFAGDMSVTSPCFCLKSADSVYNEALIQVMGVIALFIRSGVIREL